MGVAKCNHVFGPVPSRWLGRSLGVDLVPFKTCTYDCIYCQLGRTTNKTVQRKQWVPLDEVVAETETKLTSRPDYITLSGSGEPTLYSRAGELIDHIKGLGLLRQFATICSNAQFLAVSPKPFTGGDLP